MTRAPIGRAMLLAALSLALPAIAAEPPMLIDYQAEVTGPGGAPLDGPVDFVFRFFDASTGGNEVAIDEHTAAGTGAVQAEQGLVNVKIGGGLFLDGSGPGTYDMLDLVLRDHAALWLQVEIEGEVLAPRVQVTSSAYAINAATLEGRSLLEWELDTEQRIGVHAAQAAAHHARYTDAEAVAAMGPQSNANPLHHARPDAAEIVAAVAASSLVPQAPCTGESAVLRWTGSAWVCETLSAGGASGGNANGFEVVDPWGEAFDGVQRVAANWVTAQAQCQALGGRLPTATELHRNNAANGSGSIADSSATALLWTQIADASNGTRVVVRLSDGLVAGAPEGQPMHYRCVWPDQEHAVFTGDACNGAPGAGCDPVDPWTNMDARDRPPLSFAAAVNECRAYNASLPDTRRMQEAIQAGLANPTNSWLWSGEGKYWYNGNYGATIVRFQSSPDPAWSYRAADTGAVSATTSPQRFRCIGRGTTQVGALPGAPPCNGGCTVDMDRASPIYADSADRVAATQPAAAAACFAEGASLPHLDEFADLVRAGWPAFADHLWTSDPAYAYDNIYGFDAWRQGSFVPAHWAPDAGTSIVSQPADARPYRCLWRTTVEATATVCAADEVQVWNGAGYDCQAAVPGDDGGNAHPDGLPAYVDAWGNAWDFLQRDAVGWDTARQTCEAVGARLPLPGELWRVRHLAEVGSPLGQSSDTAYLWTLAPSGIADRHWSARLSDGAGSAQLDASALNFRCLWPASSGDAFGGSACHGDPADPCQQSGRRRWDRYDRAPVHQPTAAFECAQLGGRLPNFDDFQALVQDGAANGSDQPLWVSETMYWYSGNYGYATARWSGTGDASWTYDTSLSSAGLSAPAAADLRFRCVFSDAME